MKKKNQKHYFYFENKQGTVSQMLKKGKRTQTARKECTREGSEAQSINRSFFQSLEKHRQPL